VRYIVIFTVFGFTAYGVTTFFDSGLYWMLGLSAALLGSALYSSITRSKTRKPSYLTVPSEDDLGADGWALSYTAEDNDHYLAAKIYKSPKEDTYYVVLSHSDSEPHRLEEESYLTTLEEATEVADAWVNIYKEYE
jgi:uncharacterized protein YcgL (UPF0745 family)